jgi:hypothetical protein
MAYPVVLILSEVEERKMADPRMRARLRTKSILQL